MNKLTRQEWETLYQNAVDSVVQQACLEYGAAVESPIGLDIRFNYQPRITHPYDFWGSEGRLCNPEGMEKYYLTMIKTGKIPY